MVIKHYQILLYLNHTTFDQRHRGMIRMCFKMRNLSCRLNVMRNFPRLRNGIIFRAIVKKCGKVKGKLIFLRNLIMWQYELALIGIIKNHLNFNKNGKL